MPICLLKKVLPFTLTFIIGAALGGFLFNPFGVRTRVQRAVRTELRTYSYDEGRGCRHNRFRRRELVAETKPLVILFKPDARLPLDLDLSEDESSSALVRVTFGADGKVNDVKPLDDGFHFRDRRASEMESAWKAIERAARQIQFEPETINGLPVSVTKEIEIRFMGD